MEIRLPTTFISTSEEAGWDFPVAVSVLRGLRSRSVDAYLLSVGSRIGDNLEEEWRREISSRDSFVLLWSPGALHRPRVLAEWKLAVDLGKPRIPILFPFEYRNRPTGSSAQMRYVDPPPGWDGNVKFERLEGVTFVWSPWFGGRRKPPLLWPPFQAMLDRLSSWIKSGRPI